MHTEMAQYYDLIYAFKDYHAEADAIKACILRHNATPDQRLLDVACGTGRHVEHLSASFHAEGLDLSPELLELAKRRNPGIPFHCSDMRTFDLSDRFDVITCLFSAIGYMASIADLKLALSTMANHLRSNGLLIIEPWLTPEMWKPGTVHALLVDEPELKIARINTSETRNGRSVFDLHHLIGTPEGTRHVVEHHEMGLFTVQDMTSAFEAAGLDVTHDPKGITGRGLYLGVRPHE